MNFTSHMNILYNCAINVYGAVLFLAHFFSPKAKLWVKGRQNWRKNLKGFKQEKQVIWIHVSSYGEFEQGKTVIDGLFDNYPNHHLLLTFFSPSGYENLKNYPKVHSVHYLPLDTLGAAKDFIQFVQPKIALFVRYEFWFNYLQVCHQNRIPVIYFSSSFRKQQLFFKSYGSWFANQLKQCHTIFVRDHDSAFLLQKIKVKHEIAGDTRFDVVQNNARIGKLIPKVEQFKAKDTLLVFGSTWEKDEEVFLPWLNQQLPLGVKVVIAPHEIQPQKITTLRDKISHQVQLYSQKDRVEGARVLIIDNIGLLKHLYKYSAVNYIGGGFGNGIHNLLEPTYFGKPVVFGPNHFKFQEAKELIAIGAGKEVQNAQTFKETMTVLLDEKDQWKEDDLRAYFNQNLGATDKVLRTVKSILA